MSERKERKGDVEFSGDGGGHFKRNDRHIHAHIAQCRGSRCPIPAEGLNSGSLATWALLIRRDCASLFLASLFLGGSSLSLG